MIRYNIPSSLDNEISELGAVIEKFKRGEIDKTSIKSKRVPLAFGPWKKRYAVEQKKQNFYTVTIPVPLGDLSAETAERFSSSDQSFGENTIRITVAKNIQLRNITSAHLGNVWFFSPGSYEVRGNHERTN